MNTFSLRIIASDKIFFEGKATSIILPATDGLKQILAHHENLVIAINNGEAVFKTEDGNEHKVVLGLGFAEAINNRVTVLVDTAERPEDIDEKRAQAALERAKEQMRQKQSLQEYHHSQASMARAMTRLKFKDKHI